MQYIEARHELTLTLQEYHKRGISVGFVPTMGALHEGHLSLVRKAKSENEVVVVSVFVNPTQFNNLDDLQSYPRTLKEDKAALEHEGVSVLFAPSVEEMYPEPDTRQFSFSPLDTVMEGLQRPGHFNGVAQIVSKFFLLIRPRRAYFGKKDYQQLLIVKRMVEDLHLSVEIVGCPILRESDGLAISSRNVLLGKNERAAAPKIYATLQASKAILQQKGVEAAEAFVVQEINANPYLQVEYFTITNQHTLQPCTEYVAGDTMGFIAVQAGAVRLIDNIEY